MLRAFSSKGFDMEIKLDFWEEKDLRQTEHLKWFEKFIKRLVDLTLPKFINLKAS